MKLDGLTPMTAVNGIDKKRHTLLDEEDTNRDWKRVCLEPFGHSVGPDVSWGFNNSMATNDAQLSTMDSRSSISLKAKQSVYDSLEPNSNHSVFGADSSIADLSLPPQDSWFGSDLSSSGIDIPAMPNISQYDKDFLWFPLDKHDYQIQEVNVSEVSQEIALYDSNTDRYVDPAVSPRHSPNASPQQRQEYLISAQSQNVETIPFQANLKSNTAETGIKLEFSPEWLHMNNKKILSEAQLTTSMEMDSRYSTSATPEPKETAVTRGKSLELDKYSNSDLLTQLNVCHGVSDVKPVAEFSAVPQCDACFGVVSCCQQRNLLTEN